MNKPQIIKTVREWQRLNFNGQSLGFVPTMGALHAGHLSLIRKAKEQNAITAVSIYVNPTQFNDKTDFENYPSTIESDILALSKEGVDYLFLPNYSELYPDAYSFRVNELNLSKVLCGQNRPGHFAGVLTVVLKLLNIIRPQRAYFGQKDYQQYTLIKEMCKAFFLPVEIIGCKTVREKDGLALSSRNKLLDKKQRALATKFSQTLCAQKSIPDMESELIKLGFNVDYIEEHFGRRFGAVRLGQVRLIDNVEL